MTHAFRLPLAAAALAAAAVSAPLSAAPAATQPTGPYTVVEINRSYATLQEAVNAIGVGMGTIQVAAGSHADCAVQKSGIVTYTATEPGKAVFDGKACEGKAALVLRGRSAKVEGLVFANIKVADFNGAGIRLEKGNLTVSQSWFRDSQQGILTGQDPAGTVSVDKSTFTRLGTCQGAGGCAHSIYAGGYGAVSVTRSRFEAGRGGHYLKSRAATVSVLDNSFDDSAGKATNYMIDLPGGAAGRIAGNIFVQGADKENHSAFIAISAEGKTNPSAELVIESNDARFAPGVQWASVFVADWSGQVNRVGPNALATRLARLEKR